MRNCLILLDWIISSGRPFHILIVAGKKLFLCTSTLEKGVRYLILCPLVIVLNKTISVGKASATDWCTIL